MVLKSSVTDLDMHVFLTCVEKLCGSEKVLALIVFVISSLAEPVPFKNFNITSKTLELKEGTPLPVTFSLGNGLFKFSVERNLSVLFNGTK